MLLRICVVCSFQTIDSANVNVLATFLQKILLQNYYITALMDCHCVCFVSRTTLAPAAVQAQRLSDSGAHVTEDSHAYESMAESDSDAVERLKRASSARSEPESPNIQGLI